MSLEIFQFPYRQDNYGVLVHDPVSGSTACVDAGSEGAEAELAASPKQVGRLASFGSPIITQTTSRGLRR